MLQELSADAPPPDHLIVSTPFLDRPSTCNDLAAWLGVALDKLSISPPPGVVWTSYSCRFGGATAMDVAKLAKVAIARILGHARNNPTTANAHYVDALATPSVEALLVADRWCRDYPVPIRF